MALTKNFKLAKKLGLFFIAMFLFRTVYDYHSDQYQWSIISYKDTNISDNFISDNPIRAERNRSALDVDQIEDNTLEKNPKPSYSIHPRNEFQKFVKAKNPSVYDIYKFPEYHSKWQNYTYQSLIKMTQEEKKSFFQYKENQYAKHAQWIRNLCKKFQNDARVRKTNICEPSPHRKQIILLLPVPTSTLGIQVKI